MNIFAKFVLAVYMLVMIAASLMAAVLPTGLIGQEFVLEKVSFIMGRWETCGIAAGFLLVSAYLLRASLTGGKRTASYDEAIVLSGLNGKVKIASAALKELLEKIACHEAGVNSAKAEIKVESDEKDVQEAAKVKIRLRLSVSPEANVPLLGESLQEKLQDALKKSAGLAADDISIFIDTIAREVKKRVIQ
jgi:uncharacterized alkaline shock family protein YloU